MKKNNTSAAFIILQNAQNELAKLNFDSSAFWSEAANEAIEYVQYAIDEIVNDQHANASLIHQENHF